MSVDTKEMRRYEGLLADALECARYPSVVASEEATDAICGTRYLLRSAADELDELRETVDILTNGKDDCDHECAQLRAAHEATKRELVAVKKRLVGLERTLDEAFNSGDGSYRP